MPLLGFQAAAIVKAIYFCLLIADDTQSHLFPFDSDDRHDNIANTNALVCFSGYN